MPIHKGEEVVITKVWFLFVDSDGKSDLILIPRNLAEYIERLEVKLEDIQGKLN